MSFRPLAVIPVFNHPGTVSAVVAELGSFGIDILLVDDGSDRSTANVLDELADGVDVKLLRLPENRGKGGAVYAGLEWAKAHTYSHALQIDADGQHDLADVPRFLDLARRSPDSLVSGRPVYDESVPRARLIGRYVTHAWVWIETLSLALKDSMCGYRVYPVDATLAVFREEHVGRRMDFDTEIMVRLCWRGVNSVFLPTCVHYPEDGISHFRMLADNWRITKMHTRLFFGMLLRLPRLMSGRRKAIQWHRMTERGSLLGMRIVAAMTSILGTRVVSAILLPPIAGYFLLFHRQARLASRKFLARVNERLPFDQRAKIKPNWRTSFRHFLNFSRETLVKLQAWKGRELLPSIRVSGKDVLKQYRGKERGFLLVTAHLGNMEVSRSLARHEETLDVYALVYTRNAKKFSRLMDELAPKHRERLILVEEIGPDTIIHLRSLVDDGKVIVIVGDRPPANDNDRVVTVEFLGSRAPFAVGPYLLAHLLQCPVGLMFCLRENHGYHIYIEAFADRISLPRRNRERQLTSLAAAYARRLEAYALQAPLQWFNFFDFWKEGGCGLASASEVSHDDRQA